MKQPIKIVILLLSIGTAIAMYRLLTLSPSESEGVSASAPVATVAATASPGASLISAVATASPVGSTVIAPDKGTWSLRRQLPAEATIEDITAPDLPTLNKHAVRLDVSEVDPKKFWAAQILKPVPQAIQAKRDMTISFWGRSPTNTPVWVVFEQGEPPHTPEVQKRIALTPQWTKYEIPFRTAQDHTKTHADFCIKAGIEPGVTEVAGIYVEEVSN